MTRRWLVLVAVVVAILPCQAAELPSKLLPCPEDGSDLMLLLTGFELWEDTTRSRIRSELLAISSIYDIGLHDSKLSMDLG